MKKTLFAGIFVLWSGVLFASSVDVTVSEGTDQNMVESLSPEPGSREVDADAVVKLCLKEPLFPMRLPRAITLKQLSLKHKKHQWLSRFFPRKHHRQGKFVRGDVTYDNTANCLIFIPENNLSVGFYEVRTKPLTIRQPGHKMVVRPIVYRFYVPEVINGFKLPPEPDEKKNNETLLGIDFNQNGIRDDVERWIIIHYANDPKYPKTKTAIALQYAWASQKILENPTMESSKYEDDVLACQYYWFDKITVGLSGFEYGKAVKPHRIVGVPELKDKIYNTKERILKKFDYNAALSGQILTLKKSELSACHINIDKLGE